MIENEEIEEIIKFAKSEPTSVFTCHDKENANYTLWNKNVSKFPLPENILAKGVFAKKGKRFNLKKKRYYIITSSYICYKQVIKILNENENSKQLCGLSDFIYLRAEFFINEQNPKPKYCISLKKNREKSIIYTNNKDLFLEFRSLLSKNCILNEFSFNFNLVKKIGKGAFASVYLCKRLEDGELMAVKSFKKKELHNDKNGIPSLLNEIAILKCLNGHPNIIKLHQIHEDKSKVHLIMDLLTGGDLSSIISNQKIPVHEVSSILRQILSALKEMHSKKIIHRDIKPENILLSSKVAPYKIVLADFGFSTFLQTDIDKYIYKRCGTPGFVAPEVLNYDKGMPFYNEKVDVFSAGSLFYQMLTGVNPFNGIDFKTKLRLNRECKIDLNNFRLSKVRETVMELLKSMMAKHSECRPSAEESLKHLDCYEKDFFVSSCERKEIIKEKKFIIITNKNVPSRKYSEETKKNDDESISLIINKSKTNFDPQKPALNGQVESFDQPSSGSINSAQSNPGSFHTENNLSRFGEEAPNNLRKIISHEQISYLNLQKRPSFNLDKLKNRKSSLHKQALMNNIIKNSMLEKNEVFEGSHEV